MHFLIITGKMAELKEAVDTLERGGIRKSLIWVSKFNLWVLLMDMWVPLDDCLNNVELFYI